MNEHKKRTIIKSFTWRFLATMTTVTLVYLYTGELELAAEIGVVEVITKLIIYYTHERVWLNISWGKTYVEKIKDAVA